MLQKNFAQSIHHLGCINLVDYLKEQRCLPIRLKLLLKGSVIVQDIDIDAYMNDCILFINKDFEHYVVLIDKLLTVLSEAGMKCNPSKRAWVVQKTSFLGHWMTPTAVKPMKKKINAILKMERPKNQTQVRSFIGAVNFYCSLRPRRAHFMTLLTELTGKGCWNMFETNCIIKIGQL